MLEWLEHFIVDTIGAYGYFAIFVLMMLESALIPIPSEVTMVFGGFLVARGELDFIAVGMIGAVANVVGSWLAYYVGRVGGRPLAERWGRYIFLRKKELDRADQWFEERGELTVFVTRLLPVIRTFISFPAGVSRMPFWRFTIYTFLGCLPWSFALTWAGVLLGDNWEVFLRHSRPVVIGVSVITVAVIGWWLWRRASARKRERAEEDELSR
ncbi:MAG TPA: DedA family protein [Actinomycetota bacterium]|nr:DedA family protein [Actinomycetota bacterium]